MGKFCHEEGVCKYSWYYTLAQLFMNISTYPKSLVFIINQEKVVNEKQKLKFVYVIWFLSL